MPLKKEACSERVRVLGFDMERFSTQREQLFGRLFEEREKSAGRER